MDYAEAAVRFGNAVHARNAVALNRVPDDGLNHQQLALDAWEYCETAKHDLEEHRKEDGC
jgi:hypothetical protein